MKKFLKSLVLSFISILFTSIVSMLVMVTVVKNKIKSIDLDVYIQVLFALFLTIAVVFLSSVMIGLTYEIIIHGIHLKN